MAGTKSHIEIDADLQDLIPQFIENRKKDILSLLTLLEKGDMPAIGQLAHKIKGAAAGYGFNTLSSLAADIEKAAKENDRSKLSSLAEKMEAHFDNIEIHFVNM